MIEGKKQYFYAYQKLLLAVEILVSSSGGDRKKIERAYTYFLIHLEKDDLPEVCHKSYEYVVNNLTNREKVPDWDKEKNRYGTIHWASSQLNGRSINKIKKCIWDMFSSVIQARVD